MDFAWALWKTQKPTTFSQKAKNYFIDMSWTVEETSKATASNKAEDLCISLFKVVKYLDESKSLKTQSFICLC